MEKVSYLEYEVEKDEVRELEIADKAAREEIKAMKNESENHSSNKNNPHGVTKAQVGLGNVDNTADANKSVKYATNAGTAGSATKATQDASGNVITSTYATAANLTSHTGNKSNPHGVTKAQLGLGNVDNTADSDKSVKYATSAGSATSATSATKATQDGNGNVIAETYATAANLTSHTGNKSNPHGVTKTQVGLSNVPNVATNDQTPTYTAASTAAALSSGEKLSVAMGKIAKAVSDLISHLANKSNPHGVTKAQVGLGSVDNTADSAKSVKYAASAGSATNDASGNTITTHYAKVVNFNDHKDNTSNPHGVTKAQVGLGNVPNVATNNQTPTYTEASSLSELKSGETLSTAMGKLARAVYTVYHEHKYEVTGTLDAGNTQLILEHSQLAERSTIDIYTDLFGANIESVTVTDGRIVIVFEPQETVMEVKVRWDNGLV